MTETYVYANIKLKYGQLVAFCAAMEKVKFIFEQRGWKLVGAWTTVIGNYNEVHDLWQIYDANAVGAAMMSVASDPEFLKVAPELAATIESEVLSVVVKAPYGP